MYLTISAPFLFVCTLSHQSYKSSAVGFIGRYTQIHDLVDFVDFEVSIILNYKITYTGLTNPH